MHFKPVRAAARTAAVGGVAALGLGALQAAALAGPSVVHVPCNVTTLNTVITDATSGETIVLAPGCVYDLPAALPDITVQLTIVGRHSVLQRSSAGATPDFTILTVTTGGNLTVDNVNFYNGGGSTVDYGGAIYNDGGVLAVHGGTYGGNSDLDYGGAIYNDGGMQITGATFTNNSSDYGGAIYNDDQADITSTTFDHNRGTDGYAGAFYNDRNAVITHCDFISNTTEDYGGGIYNGKTLAVNDSQFQHNGAEYGGGIYNDDGVVVAD